MKKIPLSKKTIKRLDYFFWAVWMTILFIVDWRLGVAFIAFDIMRVFEFMARDIEHNERENTIYKTMCTLIEGLANDIKEKINGN